VEPPAVNYPCKHQGRWVMWKSHIDIVYCVP
jgi:hypothetical protein